jgi:RNA polymerase sigma-70 factor (ECF subfamily)
MDNKDFLKRLREDDTAAYTTLFDMYYDWLCNYIFGLCRNRALAEDLVQDTMIKFWEKRKEVRITSSLKSYLFKACHNQFLLHLRQNKVKVDLLDTINWEVLAQAHDSRPVSQAPKLAKLHSLIAKLPPRCREVFILNKLERRKYREIAADLNISIKTVENHMSKALNFMRKHATSFFL